MAFLLNRTFGILLPVLVVTIGCSRTPDDQTLRRFVEAQEAFEKAETLPETERKDAFRRSALMYRGLVDRGVRSGPIYYNMGNAWARCDEPGLALAAYRSARYYMPLDPHLASNVQTVQGHVRPGAPPTPLIEYLFFWQDWIGVQYKASISTISASLTLFFGSLCCFLQHRRLRRLARITLAFTLLACLSTGYDWYRFEWTRHALIAVEDARPRKGHSEQYETAFTTPPLFGAEAEVLERRGDWVLLRFGPGRDGWLPKNHVVEY